MEVSDFDIEVKNPYVLNQVNISSAFRMYQRDIALLNASGGLLVETNPHELLAVNNILLLKPGQHSNMMMKHFTEETFKDIHKDVATKFGIEDKEFDQEKKLAIEKILKVSSVVHCLQFTMYPEKITGYSLAEVEERGAQFKASSKGNWKARIGYHYL